VGLGAHVQVPGMTSIPFMQPIIHVIRSVPGEANTIEIPEIRRIRRKVKLNII
jgi:hypothetical protein